MTGQTDANFQQWVSELNHDYKYLKNVSWSFDGVITLEDKSTCSFCVPQGLIEKMLRNGYVLAHVCHHTVTFRQLFATTGNG